MKRKFISCKLPIRFPLEADSNGAYYFTKESFKNIDKNLENSPIVKGDMPIGILTDKLTVVKKKKEIVIYVKGFLFAECFPEVIVNKTEKINGVNVVTDFNFSAISIGNKIVTK